MAEFTTTRAQPAPFGTAPDGSDVRPLLATSGASFAHFELAPGQTSRALKHQTVEEAWYFLGGRGELWRSDDDKAEVVAVEAGVCVAIPLGTSFQLRALGYDPLALVAATTPPWPGDGEASEVTGKWSPTVA
jgi:mannose-6-phosphate isomerase-like protein (cupin superfamily)